MNEDFEIPPKVARILDQHLVTLGSSPYSTKRIFTLLWSVRIEGCIHYTATVSADYYYSVCIVL